MRSTPVVACRAVIMLAALFLVPAAALFWESIPPLADDLLLTCEERLGFSLLDPETWSKEKSDAVQEELADAPRFAPVPASPPAGPMPPPAAAPGGVALASASQAQAQQGAVQASYEVPVNAGQAPPAPTEAAPYTPSMGADAFSSIQTRLRELGATYYLLESWGDGGRYRFHCRMAIAGNTSYSRQFEATAAEPVAAMLAVLRQVEDWRAGRTP